MNSEFAFILDHKAKLSEIVEIQDCLKQDELFSTKLYERNFEKFLEEAEKMRIEKQLLPEFQPNPDNVTDPKYKQFLNVPSENLGKIITQQEKFTKFTFKDRHLFFKASNNANFEEYASIFEPSEKLRIIYQMIYKINFFATKNENESQATSMINYFHHKLNVIEEIIPLHNKQDKIDLCQTKLTKIKNSQIKKYFGENIAQYFYFLQNLHIWLKVPLAAGLVVFILNKIFHESEMNSLFDPIYSIIVIFWSSFFIVFQKRKQTELSIEWQSFGNKLQKSEHIFTGKLETRLNVVTGQVEEYFPHYKRIIIYIKNFFKILPIIVITVLILVCSLNLRGYCDPNHTFLYIESLANLSKPGAFFDSNSYFAMSLTLAHVVTIAIINFFYTQFCVKLTKNEFHLSQQSYQNSMIFKRFLFEGFTTFIDLFYLAFVRFNIVLLKQELASIFMFDEFRRIIAETVLPLIQKKFLINKLKNEQIKVVDLTNQEQEYFEEKWIELHLWEYEQFDDYLEIIINYQYIILFASGFPLAPFFILIFNYLERLSDSYKLMNLYKRPLSFKSNGIGTWLNVLNVTTFLCIYTNIILFAFASEQITEYFPQFFKEHIHSSENVIDVQVKQNKNK